MPLACFATAGWCHAQQKLFTIDGTFQEMHLGTSVAAAGDVDGDGVPDFILGAPVPTFQSAGGRAFLHSGASGAVLFQFIGVSNEQYGHAVAGIGDANGDGRADFAVASDHTGPSDFDGAVRVYSGATGATLRTIKGDTNIVPLVNAQPSVAGVGDIDGDGLADVIVGLKDSFASGSTTGRARVYSVASGAVLFDAFGQVGEQFGASVASAGDVDADGTPDFIVGGPGTPGSVSGHARVYSGATGALLHAVTDPDNTIWFGLPVSGVGDIDQDGHDDFAVGASRFAGAGAFTGRVTVYSGATGGVLHTWSGTHASEFFGTDIGPAGDYDLDGRADVLVSRLGDAALPVSTGSVSVLSGLDGSELAKMSAYVANDGFGNSAEILGDISGDGRPEFVVGASYTSTTALWAGAAHVFSLEPLTTSYCTSTPNSTGLAATIDSSGYASLVANDLVLVAEHLPANKTGYFITSTTQAQVPFGNGFRCVGLPLKRVQPGQTSSAGGVLSQAFDVTQNPWSTLIQAGATWNFQGWFRDPAAGGAGFNLTDGLAVTFLP
ncbi:FG-GAP-like repeat-containing protein [Myxococcota bacterium]|nr:FG-GAP-like repeat-containing protein [Myxococcota bacterium]